MAVGTLARRPVPISLSDADSASSPPITSRITALIHVPSGASCITGCSAWPRNVPLSASLTGPPGSRLRTCLASGSATESSGSSSARRSASSLALGLRSAMPGIYPHLAAGSLPPMAIVETEDRGAVRHVVLNRPEKRNAFNQDLVLAVGQALRAAADDPAVHCVVLRGEGAMFSSGMDLGSLAGLAE